MATTADDGAPGLEPELVLVAHPDAELRLHAGRAQAGAADIAPLNRALEETAAAPRAMFGPSETRVRARRRAAPAGAPDLSVFYRVELDAGVDHEAIARRLVEEESVAGAYVKPPAVVEGPSEEAAAAEEVALAGTPDFSGRQGYLDAPPNGVNARSAWNTPGGDGAGIDVVIVGGAWRLEHEDLHGDPSGVIAGTQIDAVSFRNHGTAMLGVVRADRNAFGVTGIAPACRARQVATFGLGTAAAINKAAEALPAGGIILVEWQRPGPGSTGVGSAGFIPIEWWPDDFAAIQAATASGRIVVVPAGNGGVSLDDPRYSTPQLGFPPTWRNPFDRTLADSGSIMVGAGAPPDGTHGNHHGAARSRLDFSNHGRCVDAQGWGAEVTTLAYGDLQGGDEQVWYTDRFGGTSAAAAIVAGVLASLQGINLAGGKRGPLKPADARHDLQVSGSPQQDAAQPAATQHIGALPELLALVALLGPAKDESKDGKDTKDEAKEGKDSKDGKDGKDNKDNPDKHNKEAKEDKDGKDHKDRKDDKGDKTETPKEIKDHGKEKNEITPEHLPPIRGEEPVAPAPWPVRSAAPVRHFIAVEHRPSLVTAALRDEPDVEREA
jgi:hypothetical protein